jgi:hypothetical protein
VPNVTYRVLRHEVEPGAATTFQKLQGKTCLEVNVDLNVRKCQSYLTYFTTTVGLSRVRLGSDLFVVPPHRPPSLAVRRKLPLPPVRSPAPHGAPPLGSGLRRERRRAECAVLSSAHGGVTVGLSLPRPKG